MPHGIAWARNQYHDCCGVQRTSSRETIPRPGSGGDAVSRCERIGLFDINLEIFDGLLNHGSLNFPFAQQFMERRERDESRVHLEEVAKRFSALAAAESVGSKRGQPPGHPLAHHI